MTKSAGRRHLRRILAIGLTAVTVGALTGAPAAAAPAAAAAAAPNFGTNVTIFDPSMPVAEIQAKLDAAHAQQVNAEMGTNRYAFLFKPGTYGTDAQPLQIKVGYYTEVSGLGASPNDVVINGKVEVYNRCLTENGTANCLALVNFWRTLSNLSIKVNGAGQDGCRAGANFWAVSQAVSLRRLNVDGGFTLMDYCTAGPQYASGGFIADSQFGAVTNGSQQQWLTRNSKVGSWSNAVWNQVFAGVEGAPSDATFPDPPYTTLEKTPLSREKPYLFVDAKGKYAVRVPNAHRNTSGTSWGEDLTSGRTIPLSDFFVAKPSDPEWLINAQLLLGKNLLFTPGVYNIDQTIHVLRPNQVVLGIGHATLTAVNGVTPLKVADVPGVIIAGVTIDAGTKESKNLLQVGNKNGIGFSSASNPTTLSDVYFRVGGPHIGKVDTALEINSDNVLIDHTWVWRGDHGVEGFTEGVNGDTQRWRTNTGRYGAVINGDNVTATGLFVEHFQKYNTVWNGEKGTTVLYQNELPYDPPTQADWMNGKVKGYAGYKVGDKVKNHSLYGAGVYVFNQNNPSIVTENGFEVPKRPGVKLHHIMTVNLSAGTINHVVNGEGGPAEMSATGTPVFITDYPAS
ncbi:adenylyl cyclase [Paractinoplanes lichenicola]|uniref:Adenylyl cyclase n=1 Tax=Paractinoplanes lichenicola TaxID=2802976 RepID=A0ABS1VT88_9ACTN|nr:adenylyl cyclase [Actinoplanes lichenicola]MBL7257676.1 adenylyl cyclase [Actinoplanes lichenicola]